MDIYERIKKEMESYMRDKKLTPNKVYISRDLCNELAIDVTIQDRELLSDDWIYGMKVVPTWFTNTVFVTYDGKLDTKDMLIEKLMNVVNIDVDEELDKQIDEDLKYLHNEILFEQYYDEWCKKKNVK